MQSIKKIGNQLVIVLLVAILMIALLFILPNVNSIDTLFIWAMILFAGAILYGSYGLIKYGKSGKVISCMVIATLILAFQIMVLILFRNLCVIC